MLLRPCLVCGTPGPTTRCEDHPSPRRRHTPKNRNKITAANRTRWKNLSARLRRDSPFCEHCGTSHDLTVDHIVRLEHRPEWAYEIDNLRVLCRRCNSTAPPATPAVERTIATMIQARKEGRNPHPQPLPDPAWQAQKPLHTGIIQEKGAR